MKQIIIKILILLAFQNISSSIHCQEFKNSPLITCPGINKNFNIISPQTYYNYSNSYICWENKKDSIYTIYLRQIDPLDFRIVKVISDTIPNINPQIAYDYYNNGITIVWQSLINNHWQLLYCTYQDDSLSNIVKLTADTLTDNTSPTLSNYSISWLKNDKLVYRKMWSDFVVIDSMNCSNPQIFKYEEDFWPSIVYEKGAENQKQIYLAQYRFDINQGEQAWMITLISNGEHCMNPSFGPLAGISCQTKNNGIWKIVYPDLFVEGYQISENKTCNFENPIMFRFPIPTNGHNEEVTDFFVAFDTDSFDIQKEIMINIKRWLSQDTLINISNSSANDKNPYVTFLNSIDSCNVGIIWERELGGKTNIWWAKAPFKLIYGAVANEKKSVQTFTLNQNYPNPFNSSTVIKYTLLERAFIEVKIYDVQGRLVKTLMDERQSAGFYSVYWDGTDSIGNAVASGIYFYSMQAGEFKSTRKMMLLR